MPECNYNHSYYWTEARANRNAADYFGRNYGVNWESDKYMYKGCHGLLLMGILSRIVFSVI